MSIRLSVLICLVAFLAIATSAEAKKPPPPNSDGEHDITEPWYFFLITGLPAAVDKFKDFYGKDYAGPLSKYCWEKKDLKDISVPNSSSEVAVGFLCDPTFDSVNAVSAIVQKAASNPPGGVIDMQYSTVGICVGLHCTKHNSTNCIKYTCWGVPQCHHNGYFCSDSCIQ